VSPYTTLPAYVRREHDDLLDAVLDPDEPASRIVVLRGGSSTGKTRSAYQAVTEGPLASWRLERPLTPADLICLLEDEIAPHTVLWLQELRHFTDADDAPEALARLDRFLPRSQQVIVLTATWQEHWSAYTRDDPKPPGSRDPYVAVRALLARLPDLTHPGKVDPSLGGVIAVPACFTDLELARASMLADPALAEAVEASELAGDPGHLAQYLAGAPDLLRHWQDQGADPYGRALITAAMDLARLGGDPKCPPDFLREAVVGYLDDDLRTRPIDEWIDTAYGYASAPLRGAIRCLMPVPPERGTGIASYELADYLDQHSRRVRGTAVPPVSFWDAATRLPVSSQATFADAAQARGLLRAAAQLFKNAVSTDPHSAANLIMLMRDVDPDVERPGDWVARRAPLRDPDGIAYLLGALLNSDADAAV
jgi:hypothetical protein